MATSEFNPAEAMEAITQMADTLSGMRNSLIAQGFTPEVAERLVLETWARVMRN